MGFLEVSKLLSKFQFGFRPKLSTELAATLLFDEIRQHVDEGKLVGATFIDLSKEFAMNLDGSQIIFFIDQWLLAMTVVCLISKIF